MDRAGAIVGSVLTESYSDFDRHARAASEALKADLLSGGRRGYYRDAGTSPSNGG